MQSQTKIYTTLDQGKEPSIAIVRVDESLGWPEASARSLGGNQAYRSGKSWYTVCPVHSDSSPSLHLSIGRGGKRVFHCFAGCPWSEVLDALIKRGLLPNERRAKKAPVRLNAWRIARAAEHALSIKAIAPDEFIPLMIGIREMARSKDEVHYASVRRVCEITPFSKSAVQRSHQKLIQAGWLLRRRRQHEEAQRWLLQIPPLPRQFRDTACSKGGTPTFFCPEFFAVLKHDVWREIGASAGSIALVYFLLKQPRTSAELAGLIGESVRTIQQRLVWLKRWALVERKVSQWRRTSIDLDSAAQRRGVAGTADRLRDKHAEERATYKLLGQIKKGPRASRSMLKAAPMLSGGYTEPEIEESEIDRLAEADGWSSFEEWELKRRDTQEGEPTWAW